LIREAGKRRNRNVSSMSGSRVSARMRTNLRGAMGAAEHTTIRFDAMSDDAAAAVITFWRQRVNRAFKAVERVRLAVHYDMERLVVFISTHFALCHDQAPLVKPATDRLQNRGP